MAAKTTNERLGITGLDVDPLAYVGSRFVLEVVLGRR